MIIVRAEAMGMCFGVRDALHTLDRLPDPQGTTIYGELVHNEQVNAALATRGFATLAENKRDNLPPGNRVVITAHGISNNDRQRLIDSGKTLIDTTCPLVQRVHDIARRLHSEGWFIVVIGKPQHVEVRGITGDLTNFIVIANLDEIRPLPHSQIAIVCQTTTRPQDAHAIVGALHDANPSATLRFVDTICRPTRERQIAAEHLVTQVQALVVVGGKHSNNTRQLVSLAQQHGLPVTHIQSAADLEPAWFAPFDTVGLTAGTSTLPETIEEVYSALEALPCAAAHAAVL